MDIKRHRFLFINIGCIVAVFVVAFIAFDIWLDSYTDHGENVTVPDFRGLDFDAAQILAAKDGLQVKVNDTLSVDDVAPGAIVDHFPSENSKVKRGRRTNDGFSAASPNAAARISANTISFSAR